MPSESGISSALAFLVLRLEGARNEGTEDWGVATFEALRSVSFGTRANGLGLMDNIQGVCLDEAALLGGRPRGAMLVAIVGRSSERTKISIVGSEEKECRIDAEVLNL